MKEKIGLTLLLVLFCAINVQAKILTYNKLDIINMRDSGIPADERSTNVMISSGNSVYGATSGDRCHIFRLNPETQELTDLAAIDGPNTVMKGMVLDGDTIYVGTMLDRRQMWLEGRRRGGTYEELDAHLYQIDDSWNTGHLYKITGIKGNNPQVEDLGIPVEGQGIYTMAIDSKRGLIYGLTYPLGRFFIYNIPNNKTETITFGTTYSHVSNHMVSHVEVIKDLTDHAIGEVEFNGKIIAKVMHVMPDGVMYTSGWRGQILKYDPTITNPQDRFSVVAYIPSVPGRQHWNRIDEIIEYKNKLYMGTSDGYILRFDPKTDEIENFGKPIRAIEVLGMTFSVLDGKLYGINGGDLDGISRFWCLDTNKGIFEVDYPAVQVFNNRRAMGDIVCTDSGTLIMGETQRVANIWMLTPGETVPWEKSGVIPEIESQGPLNNLETRDLFVGHKKLEVDVYPMPSSMHGGSGYTAIQFDNEGRVYVGGAYYGKFSPLMQLEPSTAQWRLLFRSDELTHQYGRGQGVPGKIHTKLRLGSDGKIYGAMKQGYEFHYGIRSDVGESPEGERGGQMTCHFFSYDPATDTSTDLGPGLPQEGITSFSVDIDRGYIYGVTVPGVYFLVHDLKTGRIFNAGAVASNHPSRYIDIDFETGKVYHKGETTPDGKNFMTVWDPNTFRLTDIEIVPEDGFKYSHSYAITCGPVGSNKLYGSADGKIFEMDLNVGSDGKLHVRPICTQGLDGEVVPGWPYTFASGPDGRIYWADNYGDHGDLPISLFAWNPETETKTYMGTCALGGEWLHGGLNQGICFDKKGNMAIHMLYAGISPAQREHWKVSKDFFYEDIVEQPYYLGYPGHFKGTFYSVYYLKNATEIK
ncbi:MAG: hypothetical protein JXB48_16225 [Candidatus Latescibacteria bacterium]|nr:hypothetical protein [Candidatus Latescibacterota bacterium]